MKKHIIILGLSSILFSCMNSTEIISHNQSNSEVKECRIDLIKINCDLVKSYNKAKKLILEFKEVKIGTNYTLKNVSRHNDSIFSKLNVLKQDLLKIKELLGEQKYNLEFATIQKVKEKNILYKQKMEAISKIEWEALLLKNDPERDIQINIKNDSKFDIELFVLETHLFDKLGKEIFYVEGDTIDAFDFLPKHRRDFVPDYYKGSKKINLNNIGEYSILEKAHAIKQKLINVKFKEF
ncbi:hypothetical protein [Aureivirga sp. CE67]|uniref:hypothetical protein n=1 Tax=Aureivirga sp. CE67 TaxID=1788983 RepID=UPI0018CA091B|nr:hypothetical protein [Aureivirga sp. CE67]